MNKIQKAAGKAVCKICNYMEPEYINGGRNCFYCMHPESKTETSPNRRIAQAREKEIPTKTAPHWCPLNNKEKQEEQK